MSTLWLLLYRNKFWLQDEAVLKGVREELISEAVQVFISSIKSINAPLPEVIELVQKTYEEAENRDWSKKCL